MFVETFTKSGYWQVIVHCRTDDDLYVLLQRHGRRHPGIKTRYLHDTRAVLLALEHKLNDSSAKRGEEPLPPIPLAASLDASSRDALTVARRNSGFRFVYSPATLLNLYLSLQDCVQAAGHENLRVQYDSRETFGLVSLAEEKYLAAFSNLGKPLPAPLPAPYRVKEIANAASSRA